MRVWGRGCGGSGMWRASGGCIRMDAARRGYDKCHNEAGCRARVRSDERGTGGGRGWRGSNYTYNQRNNLETSPAVQRSTVLPRPLGLILEEKIQ